MGLGRTWTEAEHTFLRDNWGKTSLPNITKKINRSPSSILNKAARFGLGPFLESGGYISYNQLFKTIGRCSCGYSLKSWVKNRDFPFKNKTVNKCEFRIIYLKDFWRWADKNRSMIDWSKFPEKVLGVEPEWVNQQRQLSFAHNKCFHNSPWTAQEDSKLKSLLKQYKYGYKELSEIMCRTSGAIQRRCIDLRLKERPVRADNHIFWTLEEKTKLSEMILSGCNYEVMADKLNKSSKALRGHVYRLYSTENIDKVREILKEELSNNN